VTEKTEGVSEAAETAAIQAVTIEAAELSTELPAEPSAPAEPSPSDAPPASGAAASASASATAAEHLPRPRIRTGAVLWGLVLVALGGWVLWVASSPAGREAALDAVLGLDPLGWTVVIVVALGATITLLALAAVIRRLQSRPHPHP